MLVGAGLGDSYEDGRCLPLKRQDRRMFVGRNFIHHSIQSSSNLRRSGRRNAVCVSGIVLRITRGQSAGNLIHSACIKIDKEDAFVFHVRQAARRAAEVGVANLNASVGGEFQELGKLAIHQRTTIVTGLWDAIEAENFVRNVKASIEGDSDLRVEFAGVLPADQIILGRL